MGKKMKLPFLSSQTDSITTTTTSWPWPSCTQTKTLSFRASNHDMLKTMNSTFSDTTSNAIIDEPQHYSLFTNSLSSHETEDIDQSASFSTASEDQSGVDPVEAVIQGLRSERLFFEPGETSSILEEANNNIIINNNIIFEAVPFKESVALSFDSQNPYLDFKKSMEEMIEAHEIKDWEGLEELLCWYLKINGKDNHGYIVGAFVDLLVGLAFNNTASTSPSTTNKNNNNNNNNKSCRCSNCDSPYSPLSFCNTSSSSSMSSSSTPNCVSSLVGVVSDQEIETPCLSSLFETEEEVNEEDDDDVSS